MRLKFGKGLQLLGDKALAQHFEGAFLPVRKTIDRDGISSISNFNAERISNQIVAQVEHWRKEKCFVGAVTYEKVIRAVSAIGKGSHLEKLIKLMKNDGYTPKQWIHEIIAMNHARAGNIRGVKACLDEILRNGWPCSTRMYNAAIVCFGKLREDEQVLKTFKTMRVSGVSINESTLSILVKACYSPDVARQVLAEIELLTLPKPISVYYSMLWVHLQYLTPPERDPRKQPPGQVAKRLLTDSERQSVRRDAQQFFRHEIPLEKNTATYNMMMKIESLFHDINKVMSLYKMMIKNNIKPNAQTYMTVIRCVADAINNSDTGASTASLVKIAQAAYKAAAMRPEFSRSVTLRLKLAEVFSNAGRVADLEKLILDTEINSDPMHPIHPAFKKYLEEAKVRAGGR
eukprot:TRINITY_DN3046_c0_g4_i1.p1 TRINITY_DN3046_c0_g4~~TRINITY_DN3046_c0_g4_i1.p1  ORF type:complete len:402 (+),score=63.01 TRINITY_DN3046_c0_g4_i1:64-1269(+)